jgi:hypothetical protein
VQKNKAGKKFRKAPPLPGQAEDRDLRLSPVMAEAKGLDAILEMENRASVFQLDVLKKIGAPAAEKNLVFRRAPRDFETGHDGNYTLNP